MMAVIKIHQSFKRQSPACHATPLSRQSCLQQVLRGVSIMKHILFAPFAVLALAAAAHAAEKEFPAKLVSHAILPANTMIAAPADAPEHLKTSACV
jgi:hypothetical protein